MAVHKTGATSNTPANSGGGRLIKFRVLSGQSISGPGIGNVTLVKGSIFEFDSKRDATLIAALERHNIIVRDAGTSKA